MWEWIKENWIWVTVALVAFFLGWWAVSYLTGEKKVDPQKELSLQSPYMKGPEVCRLQAFLRQRLEQMENEDPSDYIIDDCIFGPSTQDALEVVTGKASTSLAELSNNG